MDKHIKYFTGILLLIVFVFAASQRSEAQISCDITINVSLPVCPEYTYILSVPFHDNCTYEWKENESILPDEDNEIIAFITTETTFSITVKDTITSEECMSDLVVTTHPRIKVDFKQLQRTCTNTYSDNPDDENKTKTAVMQAIAGDEFEPGEYEYLWDVSPLQIDPEDPSIVLGLKAYQKYFIDVKDNYGCVKRDTAIPKAYPNPVIDFIADPNPVYIQKPYVTFSFVNLSADSISITNHVWDYDDCNDCPGEDPCCNDITTTQDMPTHTYLEPDEYFPSLLVYSQYGCDTLYVQDTALEVKPVNLKIPNVFTPNGDGANDTFVITEAPPEEEEDGLKSIADDVVEFDPINTYYERTELVIFNRQGRIVYRSNDYKNDWDGSKLPDAVYFYVLKCFGFKSDDVYKGSVTIYGSGR